MPPSTRTRATTTHALPATKRPQRVATPIAPPRNRQPDFLESFPTCPDDNRIFSCPPASPSRFHALLFRRLLLPLPPQGRAIRVHCPPPDGILWPNSSFFFLHPPRHQSRRRRPVFHHFSVFIHRDHPNSLTPTAPTRIRIDLCCRRKTRSRQFRLVAIAPPSSPTSLSTWYPTTQPPVASRRLFVRAGTVVVFASSHCELRYS